LAATHFSKSGGSGTAAWLLRLAAHGDRHPLVELVLRDGRVAHLGDGPRGHAVAAAGEGKEAESGRGKGKKRVCEGTCHVRAAAKGSEQKFRDLKVGL
jgi:hypothetical protein